VGDAFSPIRGKCTWWREQDIDEDIWDTRLPTHAQRVDCWCFVEGRKWTITRGDVPLDCPDARHCRYHIKHW